MGWFKGNTNVNTNTKAQAGDKPIPIQTGNQRTEGFWEGAGNMIKNNPKKTGAGLGILGTLGYLAGKGEDEEPLSLPTQPVRKAGGGVLAQATRPQEQPYDFQKDLDDIKDDMNKANRLLFASGLLGNTSMGKAAAAAAQLYGESSNSKRTALSKMAEIEAKKKDAILEELKTRAEIGNLTAMAEQRRMMAKKYQSEMMTTPMGSGTVSPDALSAQIPTGQNFTPDE